MEFDILKTLLRSPDCRLQRREIKNNLKEKYISSNNHRGPYDDEKSLDVVLQRKLNKLLGRYLEKQNLGHQRVYYYIPKARIEEVEEVLKLGAVQMIEDGLARMVPLEYMKKLKELAWKGMLNVYNPPPFYRILKDFNINSPEDLEKFWLEEGYKKNVLERQYSEIEILRMWLEDPSKLLYPFFEMDYKDSLEEG